jgi:pimeloyl-ACP methyl ester carboxylesterase
MNIVYIHGAIASGDTFNYIRSQVTGHDETILEYSSSQSFYRNRDDMLERLKGLSDIVFVAHSLGGVYAMHLANEIPDRVLGAVTLSTPYGGSGAALFLRMLPALSQVQLLKDIQPFSGPITDLLNFRVVHPWTNVVTVGGASLFMPGPNDGVVTKASMSHRKDIELVELDANHYEVVLHPVSVGLIKDLIRQMSKVAA